MLELIAEIVKLLVEGAKSAEDAADDEDAKSRELVALQLARRRIETEIAKRTLPP